YRTSAGLRSSARAVVARRLRIGSRFGRGLGFVARAFNPLRGRGGLIVAIEALAAAFNTLAEVAHYFADPTAAAQHEDHQCDDQDLERSDIHGSSPNGFVESLGAFLRIYQRSRLSVQVLGSAAEHVLVSFIDRVEQPGRLELLDAWKVLAAGETEVAEELRRRGIDHRASRHFAPACDPHPSRFHEYVQRAGAGLDAADSLNLGAAYGFVIGDDSEDRKSTRLNSSHVKISYAVFC